MTKKVFNFTTEKDEIKELIREQRHQERKSIVFTNGCFDLIHSGHAYVINESKKLGDILIVGMNSDKSIKLLKGEDRPIVEQEERIYMLTSLSSVDYLIIFDEYNVVDLISFIQPDIITKASEYSIQDLENVGGKVMRELGGELKLIPYKPGLSTSNLVKKLNELKIY